MPALRLAFSSLLFSASAIGKSFDVFPRLLSGFICFGVVGFAGSLPYSFVVIKAILSSFFPV